MKRTTKNLFDFGFKKKGKGPKGTADMRTEHRSPQNNDEPSLIDPPPLVEVESSNSNVSPALAFLSPDDILPADPLAEFHDASSGSDSDSGSGSIHVSAAESNDEADTTNAVSAESNDRVDTTYTISPASKFIDDKPHQPLLQFPPRAVGKQTVAFKNRGMWIINGWSIMKMGTNAPDFHVAYL